MTVFCSVVVVVSLLIVSVTSELSPRVSALQNGIVETVAKLDDGVYRSLSEKERKYADYLKAYGKDLANVFNAKRLQRFISSYELVNSHNGAKDEHSYKFTLRINHFSDLLEEEKGLMFGEYQFTESSQASQASSAYQQEQIAAGVFRSHLPPIIKVQNESRIPANLNWGSKENPLKTSLFNTVHNQVISVLC